MTCEILTLEKAWKTGTLLGRLSLSVQGYKLCWAPEMFSLDPHGLHIIFIGNGKKRREKYWNWEAEVSKKI